MRKILILVPLICIFALAGCKEKPEKYTALPTEDIAASQKDETSATDQEDSNDTSQENQEVSGEGSQNEAGTPNVSDDKFAYTIHGNLMDLDSDKGPYYIINTDTMEVVDCTSTGAKVVSYKKSGSTLTITLYSDEYPVNSTYVINMDSSTTDEVTTQSIENNILKFSSEKGPDYEIDLNTMKLISCSDKTGRIVEYSKDGDTLTLVVYSGKLPVDMTYTFSLK